MLIVAGIIAVFTFVICIWNIVFHARYLVYPGYDIFFELLMMIFISLEGYLFASYVKGEEEFEENDDQSNSSGSDSSPPRARQNY